MATVLLENGPMHGRTLLDLHALRLVIPGGGEYKRVGTLENGVALFRWVEGSCSHPYARVDKDGNAVCRYCDTVIEEEMGS